MKDSYEKDPFAEYDKYWDDLDKKEETKEHRSHKAYRFDTQKSDTSSTGQNKALSMFVKGIIIFVIMSVFISVFRGFLSGDGFTFSGMVFWPFAMMGSAIPIIFIIFVVSIIIKASKRD